MKTLEELRTKKLSEFAESFQEKVSSLDCVYKLAEEIYGKFEENTDYQYTKDIESLNTEFSSWGKYLTISDIKKKEVYEEMLITLTEMFGEGEKTEGSNNCVKYDFKKTGNYYSDTVYITFSVSILLTGCKMVKETFTVPEHIEPAHLEEKTKIVCD